MRLCTSLKLSNAARMISCPPRTRHTAASSSSTNAFVLQNTHTDGKEEKGYNLSAVNHHSKFISEIISHHKANTTGGGLIRHDYHCGIRVKCTGTKYVRRLCTCKTGHTHTHRGACPAAAARVYDPARGLATCLNRSVAHAEKAPLQSRCFFFFFNLSLSLKTLSLVHPPVHTHTIYNALPGVPVVKT